MYLHLIEKWKNMVKNCIDHKVAFRKCTWYLSTDMEVNSRRTPTLMFDTPLQLATKPESGLILIIKTPIDRIRADIRIRPLITDTQTNTLNW